MRLGQTSALYTASKYVGSLLGFVATVYFARVLGESVLGQYALITALLSWVLIVGRGGLARSLTKRISEGRDPDRYLWAGVVIAGAVVVLASAAVLLLEGAVDDYVGVPTAAEFVVLLIVFRGFKFVVVASLEGDHLVHVASLLGVGEQTVRPVAQIALVVVGWGLGGMVVGYALSSFLMIVAAAWYLDVRPARPGKRHFASLFDFAKFSWLGNVSQRFYGTLDIMVLGAFVTSGLVGVYSVTWSIVTFLTIFGSGIRATLFPEMSKLSTEHGPEAVADLTEKSLAYSGVILVPGLVGGLLVGDRLLRIYGSAFVQGTRVLGILAAAALVWTYNRQLQNTLTAIDRPELAFRSNAVFVASNAALNVVLIALYGFVGAAVATLASAVVGLGLSWRYARSTVDPDVPVREFGRQCAAALVMGAFVYGAQTLGGGTVLSESNAAFVGALVGLGAAVYFGVLLGISQRFRRTVVRNLPAVAERG